MALNNEELNAVRIAADVIRARPDMLAGIGTDEEIARRLIGLAKTIHKELSTAKFGEGNT